MLQLICLIFKFCISENSKTPYSATVMINDMEYGSGSAISKKMAKSEAGVYC